MFLFFVCFFWFTAAYTLTPNPIGSMYTKATGPILTSGAIPSNPLFMDTPKLNPNWYVIGESKDFNSNQPEKITLYGNSIAVWKDRHSNYAAISDICPHRGASISKGRIDNVGASASDINM